MSEDTEATESAFRELIAHIKAGALEAVEGILRHSAPQLANKIETQFRQPPLYFAALASGDELSAEMIKLLLRYGANAKFKDYNQQTILFYIFREGKEKCAEILLAHGLGLDEMDVYGQTAMYYAVSENRLELVRRYATKERLAHVDKLVGQTPLYYAARRGHTEMCKLLIERGANPAHLDSHGKTAVEYARKAKFQETAEYLSNEVRKAKEGKGAADGKKDDKDPKQTYRLVFMNEKGEPHQLSEQQAAQLLQGNPYLRQLLQNPDSLSEQQLASTEVQTWQKAALRILAACCKLKGSYYFLQPVDPVKFNILDYFTIITRPMDLGTVKKRLLHNCYAKPEAFVEDMQLIWNNSYRYNGEAHIVSKCGKELENAFNDLIVSNGLVRYLHPPQAEEAQEQPQEQPREQPQEQEQQ